MIDTVQAGDAASSQLTVIITTSPTPSAPSTELISAVLASFSKHCPELLSCKVIVVFDTYDHITPIAKFKRAQVTQKDADAFVAYKQNIKQLIIARYGLPVDETTVGFTSADGVAEFGSPLMETVLTSVNFTVTESADRCITFVEPQMRLGFALAVRSALRIVTTPYVWIQQHDWRLAAEIPLAPLIALMRQAQNNGIAIPKHPPIEYVTFPSVRTLRYAVAESTSEHAAFRRLTRELKQDFAVSLTSDELAIEASTVKIPLTPLFMWLDKPHLASRAHYLDRIFPTRLAVSRGDFIEDTVGQRARAQMKEGEWERWATWMYYPGEGEVLCLHHLQGRTFRGEEGERKIAEMWRERNARERTKLDLEAAAKIREGDAGRAGGTARINAEERHGQVLDSSADKTDEESRETWLDGLDSGRDDDLDLPR
jgi:feruloyl esterase